ncbi:RNA 2'-phosphotransferase [Pararhizobium polonicum]|uniref:Probable RNA 2'-phosphotransferase n=1 Tax=Pararhizobium polonicum TaxID=1612624 RepID=A0A1C7P713_9HYPH|nr:RNA 2'-phosphotransferase [Pararhizobium polonicum]OBZ96987.1 RNA 2'-phosphotransferase [Pararhizobium polonicum]
MSVQTSKFLSYVLRHAPESIGLTLDAQGWADIAELISKANAANHALDVDTLHAVVADSDKKRFTISEDGKRIRAAQGHSVSVKLGHAPVAPPPILYHGTATRFLESIRAQGLLAGGRQQVHLSSDMLTAKTVGQRHGKPVVLTIDAQKMAAAGFAFFRADNGVWLTDTVPPAYLAVAPDGEY